MKLKSINTDEFLWSEKFRPASVNSCILPDNMKKFFNSQIKAGEIQNALLYGPHGAGKTTAARALVSELGCDLLFINGSRDTSVDILRTKVTQFASTMSLTGKNKVVIIDEADYFSQNGQAALRGLIESVSKSCRFILTANYLNKIINPLKSRLVMQSFTLDKKDIPKLAHKFFDRCVHILNHEKIEFDNGILGQFIKINFPDYRKIVNELQRAALIGPIDKSIFNIETSSIIEYISAIKEMDFKKGRKFIGEMLIEPVDFFDKLFIALPDLYKDQAYANAIITLNDHQYKHAFVANPILNLTALTIQLMIIMNEAQ